MTETPSRRVKKLPGKFVILLNDLIPNFLLVIKSLVTLTRPFLPES